MTPVINAIFDEYNLDNEAISQAIEVGPSSVVWVQPMHYRPVKKLTFEQAQSQVRADYVAKMAKQKAQEAANQLAKQINTSAQVPEAFRAVGSVTRNSTQLASNEISAAFSQGAKRLQASSVELSDGFSVIASQRDNLEPIELNAEEERAIRNMYSGVKGQQDLLDYIRYAVDSYDVNQEKQNNK